MVTFAKIVILLTWAAVVLNLVYPLSEAVVFPLYALGVFLLVGHFAEYLIFQKTIKEKGDTAFTSFWKSIIFGLVYVKWD